MESRIEELLEKYWEANTTLQEEEELKTYFSKNETESPTAQYVAHLNELQEVQPKRSFTHPGKKHRQTWLSIAASITLGVSVAFWVLNDAQRQREYVIDDPQEAYEMTRKALFMVSATLNEGVSYSDNIAKIDEAQELIKESKTDKK